MPGSLPEVARGGKPALVPPPESRQDSAASADRSFDTSVNRSQSNQVYPINPSGPNANPGQPGEAAPGSHSRATGSDLRTQLGEPTLQPRQDAKTELQEGRVPPQVSNVPGTTSSSPLGGSGNSYGTFGIPIFPQDISQAKTGNPQE